MMTTRRFTLMLLALLLVGSTLRFAWLRADPPVVANVGIVWHDEGAWTHNARNRALWGVWRTDDWNPVFVAPVFTALEYASFEAFGVGTWQARMVPAVSGLVAVVCLVAGLSALAGPRVALLGGAFLAINYPFVMWNRAALMESTMTSCMVVAWASVALSERQRAWALVAGAAAAAAWFTKAAAAFFVAALVLDVAWSLLAARGRRSAGSDASRAVFTLGGLALAFAAVLALFVLPNWSEYRFYNWQMSVTRKPEYSLAAFADRASWIPIVQGLFSRMWLELVAGSLGLLAILARWQTARPAERLLVLWVALGLAELVVHDSGNERRYVMFLPAFIALGALLVGRIVGRPATGLGEDPRTTPWPLVAGACLVLGYLVAGSALRLAFQADVDAHQLRMPVRLAALGALATAAAGAIWRRRLAAWLVAPRLPRPAVAVAIGLAATLQLAQYATWTRTKADTNYQAAVALGRLLPEGTLVQGKLANGLLLENRIRPLFIGNGFGNYADRLGRDDARYILTYDLPRIGYESSDGSGLIQGILDHYPRRQVVGSFVVDETPLPDRAVLIDKFPERDAGHARD